MGRAADASDDDEDHEMPEDAPEGMDIDASSVQELG
jgi:hypothetical protein